MSMEHPEKQKNAVKSVVDQVMDGIISQIIDGTLHPGDKLPTEMELCKQFGAGRNSVREAVKKLQAYGILYIKRADGTFVSENYNQKMLDPMLYSIILQKNSWQEFVELRSVIDIGTLNIIIQRKDITSFLPDLYRTFGELSAEMHSPEPSVDKVLELARLLTVYCGRMIVHIIPFTEIQEEIRRQCPEEYFTLIMRRFMMRLAEAVARKSHASALVTGESLGQVASQTIKALGVTEDVTKMPVLRPLIGTDKVEIIRMAREIGTYETSILPYEDCCTVFTPRHPATRPVLEHVVQAESVLDIDGLVAKALEGETWVRVKP